MEKQNEFAGTVLDDKFTQLHYEPIQCTGCEELFAISVRENPYEDRERFCANCFAHRFNLKDYEKVTNSLSKLQNILWNIPVNKLPDDVRDQIVFINPKMNKKKKHNGNKERHNN